MQKVFEVKDNNINQALAEALEFINLELNNFKLNNKELINAQLMAEEALASLIEHADFNLNNFIKIKINKLFGDVKLELTAPGAEFDFLDEQAARSFDINDEDETGEALGFINNILLKSFEDKLKYKHVKNYKGGEFNQVKILASKSRHKMLYYTLAALVLGAVLGVIFKNYLSLEILNNLNNNIFTPVKTMIFSALKMLIAPIVLFSIAGCIAQFENFGEMGKVGGRLLSYIFLSSIFAAALGIAVYYLFKPFVEFGVLKSAAQTAAAAPQNINFSVKDMIVGIVPSNFLRPLLELNMLQIIFIAVIAGSAVVLSGSYAQTLRNFFDAGGALFIGMIGIIVKLIPLAVFCSVIALIIETGVESLALFVQLILIFLAALFFMIIFYLILIIICRLNPLKFIIKYAPAGLQTFALSSSSAAIPFNMDACKKLGISQKVYALAIPLGATINMNGTCIMSIIFSLLTAVLFGVEVPSSIIPSFCILVIMISVGIPGMPGVGLAFYAIFFEFLGVPMEAIGFVMGPDTIADMACTMTNCMGDVAGAVLVSKSMGLLDEKVYNS